MNINSAKRRFASGNDDTDFEEKDQIFYSGWLNKCGWLLNICKCDSA